MAAVISRPTCQQLLVWVAAWILSQQLCPATEDSSGAIASLDGATAIHVEPAEVRLRGEKRRQQLLVTAEFSDGRLRDVTHLARFESHDRAVAIPSDSAIEGRSDGQTLITVRVGDHTATLPVQVSGFAEYPPVHFANDVVPLLSKLGCNSGGCHGRAAGQNGFKLSVFGFDPSADYEAITKEGRARRIFLASGPTSSSSIARSWGNAGPSY